MRKSIFYILILFLSSAFAPLKVGNLMYYKGTLGNNVKIQVNFEVQDSVVRGSYIEEESGDVYVLKGQMNTTMQRMVLSVFDLDDRKVATIKASYYMDTQQQMQDIDGYWISTTGKTLRLNLEKVAEVIAWNEVKVSYQPPLAHY